MFQFQVRLACPDSTKGPFRQPLRRSEEHCHHSRMSIGITSDLVEIEVALTSKMSSAVGAYSELVDGGLYAVESRAEE